MSQFIGLFIAMAFLSRFCMAECPTKDQSEKVDAEKFSGEWFAVSVIRPEKQVPTKCGRLNVHLPSFDEVNMEYTVITIHTNTPTKFVINATLDDDFNGTWTLQEPVPKILGTFKHRIIASDYDSYLAMIGCDDSLEAAFLMILSREKTLLPEILSELKALAGLYVDSEKIVDVDQSC